MSLLYKTLMQKIENGESIGIGGEVYSVRKLGNNEIGLLKADINKRRTPREIGEINQ